MKIIAVIPAWNESQYIIKVVKDLQSAGIETVVVDDASSDDTYIRAEQAGATVLRQAINCGQGAALRLGSRWAKNHGADIIIHFDGDGQFLVSDLPSLTAPLKTGEAEIVFGSRFLRANNELPFMKRYLILPLARLVNRIFFGIKLTDPQSGLRAFRAEILDKIIWQENRMAHCSEILWLAHKQNLKIKEMPMTVIYHHYGQNFGGGIRILKDLFFNKLNN